MSCKPLSSSESLDSLLQRWDENKIRFNGVVEEINKALEEDDVSHESLDFGRRMLETQRDEAEEIFKKVKHLLKNTNPMICGINTKKLQAYSFIVIETLSGLTAAATSVIQAARDTPTPTMAKTIVAFTLATLTLSKIKDYFFRNWNIDEQNQKIRLKIEGEASIIANAEATIQLIEHFESSQKALEQSEQMTEGVRHDEGPDDEDVKETPVESKKGHHPHHKKHHRPHTRHKSESAKTTADEASSDAKEESSKAKESSGGSSSLEIKPVSDLHSADEEQKKKHRSKVIAGSASLDPEIKKPHDEDIEEREISALAAAASEIIADKDKEALKSLKKEVCSAPCSPMRQEQGSRSVAAKEEVIRAVRILQQQTRPGSPYGLRCQIITVMESRTRTFRNPQAMPSSLSLVMSPPKEEPMTKPRDEENP